MNKNFRVITINGIRGIFTVIFLMFGLIAGFVIFPGWVCMHIWNYIFRDSSTVVLMNIYEGIILWAIIALAFYALNNKRAVIGFGSFKGLSPEQIEEIIAGADFKEQIKAGNSELVKKKETTESENEQKVQIQQDETQEEINK